MPTLRTSSELLVQIEQALHAQGYATCIPEELYAPIHYTLELGGKRVRPLLCLLSAQLFSADIRPALPMAVALEVFHNFTLLHDDLMDRSPLRRGQPTVYRKWDENTAVLSGDVMSIEAYRALEGIASAELLYRVFPIFNQMAVDICRGQQYDMLFECREDVSTDEYLEMIRLKTAVLLGASMRLGALASGASAEDAERLDEVGQRLGLAFQIQDDYLDVYGDEATFGKPIGGDIMNAKKTLMLLYTREQLEARDLVELDRLMTLGQEHRQERIQGVTALYDKAGAPVYARAQITRLTQEALGILGALSLEPERTAPLVELFDSLASRMS
ncbi:polyprenyl synthetase family protein [Porphyromonas sp. COT-290 OH3588]|uniref:polyprenyl synthetase family protein n=1 Tax=Porphyromonas sp. COT-290 OH3588 TaxID=1515617 RepID=UPI00052B6075|nr:polyprenyl synthetase family protein [Porphyromonas sp. COT-290 OH3588]KGO01306.1 isoprenyl synthetase [Porphyromonas sp. COT-290 OH3588]